MELKLHIFQNKSFHNISKIKLQRVNIECSINFAKTFDITDEPVTDGINFEIIVESDDDADK